MMVPKLRCGLSPLPPWRYVRPGGTCHNRALLPQVLRTSPRDLGSWSSTSSSWQRPDYRMDIYGSVNKIRYYINQWRSSKGTSRSVRSGAEWREARLSRVEGLATCSGELRAFRISEAENTWLETVRNLSCSLHRKTINSTCVASQCAHGCHAPLSPHMWYKIAFFLCFETR